MLEPSATADDFLCLGETIARLHGPSYAQTCYKRAIELAPDNIDAWLKYSQLLRRCRQFGELEETLFSALQCNPDSEKIFAAVGHWLELQHRLQALDDFLISSRPRFAQSVSYHRLHARLLWRKGRYEDAELALTKASDCAHQTEDLAKIDYLWAQVAEARQDYDRAFEFACRANTFKQQALIAKGITLTAEKNSFRAMIRELQDYNQPANQLKLVPTVATPPLFVSGFPRSGTTLVGRILDTHPDLVVADEHDGLRSVIRKFNAKGIPYPGNVEHVNDAVLATLRNHYRSQLFLGDQACNVDKYPFNFLHIPLIQQLFPGAKMIMVVRHPLDVCLSCYFQEFADIPSSRNFLTLESTAEIYNDAMSLFKSYREKYGRYLHIVHYEQLVADTQAAMAAVWNYIKVNPNVKMEPFYRRAFNQPVVQTPSYHQVIRPIFSSAVYRWQHYRESLQDIMPRLQRWCDYFGYSSR